MESGDTSGKTLRSVPLGTKQSVAAAVYVALRVDRRMKHKSLRDRAMLVEWMALVDPKGMFIAGTPGNDGQRVFASVVVLRQQQYQQGRRTLESVRTKTSSWRIRP